ncbi:recombinase family protein [bacterium]|nr:recombinase family protein [bacterium]
MKAFSYLRVSGKSQVDGHGFPRQRQVIAQYAKANKIVIAAEFMDEGISGTKDIVDRDGLAALFDRIEANGVRCVLVERADRLARDLLISEIINARFRDLGVTVVEAASGTELTADDADPTKVLIRQILGAIAEFDKNVIVKKLRAARDRKRSFSGRCEGQKPFGSTPHETMILDRILKLRRKPRNGRRMSFQKIADQLNEQQFYARSGKPWLATTIRNIVARENRSLV